MFHRVSTTLGRSSQAQNIAASRLLTFSGFQQSRRRSRILRLSLIFATFDTSISSSVFFSVRCRFARSFLMETVCALISPSRHHGVLSRILSDTSCNDVAGICSIILPAVASLGLALLELAGSALPGPAGFTGVSANWSLIRLAAPCPVCGVQPPAVVVGASVFLEAVLPFVRGTQLSDLALVCLLVLLCTWSTPVSGRVRPNRNVSGTLSSTVLLHQAAWGVVLRSDWGCVHVLSHGSNCRFLPVPRSVPWPDRCVDDLLRVRPLFSGLSEQSSLRHSQSKCTR